MASWRDDCYCEACTIAVSDNAEWVTFFPTPRNEKPRKKEKKMADKFKVVVKDGQSSYDWSAKTNSYKNKVSDDVMEFDNVAEALAEFLYRVTDDYENNKATLVYVPSKKKDKK